MADQDRLTQIDDRHKMFSSELEALRQGPVEIGDLLMALRQVHADRGYLLEQVAVLQKSDTALRDRLVEDETAFRSEISDMEDRAAEAEIELECRHQNALAAAGKAAQERDAARAEDLSTAVLAAEQLRQRAAPAMPLDRAKQIGADLVRVFMESMGVPGHPVNVPRLRSYTLAEMLEAMRVLAETEKREEAEAKAKAAAQGGRYSHTIYQKVADRGIAAIYALLHHEADHPQQVEPIISLGSAALLAVLMPPQKDDADEEDDRG